MKQNTAIVAENAKTESEYAPLLHFARDNNNIVYSKLDAYTTSSMNLFALKEDFDFDALNETLDKIIAALPAMKRIFARPITRLEDTT